MSTTDEPITVATQVMILTGLFNACLADAAKLEALFPNIDKRTSEYNTLEDLRCGERAKAMDLEIVIQALDPAAVLVWPARNR